MTEGQESKGAGHRTTVGVDGENVWWKIVAGKQQSGFISGKEVFKSLMILVGAVKVEINQIMFSKKDRMMDEFP